MQSLFLLDLMQSGWFVHYALNLGVLVAALSLKAIICALLLQIPLIRNHVLLFEQLEFRFGKLVSLPLLGCGAHRARRRSNCTLLFWVKRRLSRL